MNPEQVLQKEKQSIILQGLESDIAALANYTKNEFQDISSLKNNLLKTSSSRPYQQQFTCEIFTQQFEQRFPKCFHFFKPKIQSLCKLSNSFQNSLSIINKQSQKIIYYINLSIVRLNLISQQSLIYSKHLKFFKLGVGQSLIIQFSQIEQKNSIAKFFQVLVNRIHNSQPYKYNFPCVIFDKSFNQRKYLLQRQFVHSCQTGDLLLFNNSTFLAKVQRLFTLSDYDHVGIIVKDPQYGLLIYQSSSTLGVSLTAWSLILRKEWYKNLKLVWRKLENVKKNKQFEQTIQKFIYENQNSKYHISFKKLMADTSYIPAQQSDKGYFCSQLVASIYKKLKLLPGPNSSEYKPSCTYLPYHFTQKGNLQLEEGNLSPQYQILFHENILKQDYGY